AGEIPTEAKDSLYWTSFFIGLESSLRGDHVGVFPLNRAVRDLDSAGAVCVEELAFFAGRRADPDRTGSRGGVASLDVDFAGHEYVCVRPRAVANIGRVVDGLAGLLVRVARDAYEIPERVALGRDRDGHGVVGTCGSVDAE